jgi:hypothetical protein
MRSYNYLGTLLVYTLTPFGVLALLVVALRVSDCVRRAPASVRRRHREITIEAVFVIINIV